MNLLSWMLAVMAMGGMLGFAAWIVEWIAARYHAPRRIGWGLALVLAMALPVVPLALGTTGSVAPPAQPAEAEVSRVAGPDLQQSAQPHSSWFMGLRARVQRSLQQVEWSPQWNRVLAWGWGTASLATLFLLALGPLHLARQQRTWETVRLRGRDVLIAPKLGPLVLGLWRPRIVLPASYRNLPEADLAMVIHHEDEHIRAGDPFLLALGMLPLVLFPWSPGVWWMFHRQRIALEVDCDRRVLTRGARAAAYGGLLVRLGSSSLSTPLALHPLTLSAKPSLLERRLHAMTRSSSSPSLPVSLAGVSVALALVLLACATTPPVVSDGPMAQRAAAAAPLSSEPTFTPFTVAPEILNRSDVAVALNANYPEELRNAGIGGTALLFLFIDDEGRVQNIRIHQTSGFDALDQAALRVARVFEFSPAMNRDERVPVWIQIPVTFTTR